jgi:hypothetical protein
MRARPAAQVKPYRGPPMTLGNAAAAGVRLIVWCRECGHPVEPDPGEMAARYGAETAVPDWHARLSCYICGSRQIEFAMKASPVYRTSLLFEERSIAASR